MQRVLSGTRPTGKAHLGNLAGAFLNWVRLQEEYECFYVIVDWHALTTDYTNTRVLRPNTLEMVRDLLALGLDPRKSVIFLQSQVPEHTELHLAFSMIVSLSRLLRVPTFKEHLADVRADRLAGRGELAVPEGLLEDKLGEVVALLDRELGRGSYGDTRGLIVQKLRSTFNSLAERLVRSLGQLELGNLPGFDAVSYGFLGYPVLQTADIALYKGEKVPVGEDQLPHLELSRELVRRFNSLYGQVFPVPEPLLSPVPRILGSDGRKMSKRYDNGIYLADTPEETERKLRAFFTDPDRIRKTDPGHPERCPVFSIISAFLPDEASEVEAACRAGKIGCVECKRNAAEGLNRVLAPYRERRARITEDEVVEVLREGSERARRVARATMDEVKKAMGLSWL